MYLHYNFCMALCLHLYICAKESSGTITVILSGFGIYDTYYYYLTITAAKEKCYPDNLIKFITESIYCYESLRNKTVDSPGL